MATIAPDRLRQIAADPERVAALHGLVGEFCHLLRNRLNSLQMSLYLARRDEAKTEAEIWDDLERQYRAAEGVVDLFQLVCRPMTLTPVTIGLGLLIGEFASRWTPRFSGRGITFSGSLIESDGPSRLAPSRLGRGLEAVASWGLDGGGSGTRMSLRGWVAGGRSRLEWCEDAPLRPGDEGELPL